VQREELRKAHNHHRRPKKVAALLGHPNSPPPSVPAPLVLPCGCLAALTTGIGFAFRRQSLQRELITANWDEFVRVAGSLQMGT